MSPDKEGTHTIIKYGVDNEPVEGHSAYQLSEFYLVRGKVGARLSLVFGQGRDPAVDILTQIQQRYLKPSFIKGTISITAQILL